MTRGITSLICGVLAIIAGGLCLLAGAGGFGWFVMALFTIALVLAAVILSLPATKKGAPKDVPDYKPSQAGQWLGLIGFFELLASGLIAYLS